MSFVLLVLLPAGVAAWYLSVRAVDQYASRVGFTVRREEAPNAVDLLGRLGSMSSTSSSDSDILYEFIQSQELVRSIDGRLDLRSMYSIPHDQDPIFALVPNSNIEELLEYWHRMVQISYAPGTGLIELTVLAFDPDDAQTIAQEIFRESSAMINRLSAIAREDAMRYSREELHAAIEQLKQARQAVTAFRSRTQIVDPQADIQLQMGLLNTLQQQLGEELINHDLLRETAQPDDPRLTQAERRIRTIRERIAAERQKFGGTSVDGQNFAAVVAEFERLNVDRQFAEQKYTGALSNFDAAQAEAQRQSRYLAAYLRPTLAESAEYPRRILLFGLCCLFLLAGWAIMALIYYSLRDRR